MNTSESKYGLHHEAAAVLRRAHPIQDRPAAIRSNAIKLISTVSFGTSVMVDDLVLIVLTFCAGAIGLWFSFLRDDATAELTVDEYYDPRTGLPLASALPHVFADEFTMRTLTGRIAIITIDVQELARRSVIGDTGAANALLATTTHRLQSQAWNDSNPGPFSSMMFLRRPGTFVIISRDVLDDRTTRWLSEKILSVVNQPVSWMETMIDPAAVLGAAVGTTAELDDLPALAGEARNQARRGESGSVVILHRDRPEPPPASESSLIDIADGARVGRLFSLAGVGSGIGMFEGFSVLIRTLDRALNASGGAPLPCLVVASATSLLHPDATGEIIARVNAANANGRIGLVLPPEFPIEPGHRAVQIVQTLHDCGVMIYVDRSNAMDVLRGLPVCAVDGVIIGAGSETSDAPDSPATKLRESAVDRGAIVVRRISIGAAPQSPSSPAWPIHSSPANDSDPERGETDRLIRGGQPAQLATDSALTLR